MKVDGGLSIESGIAVPENRYAAGGPTSVQFRLGAADVDAFFEEIRHTYPKVHGDALHLRT